MTLREAQSIFLKNVSKLILWAFENGYELTGGELQRTKEQQILYFEGKGVKKINSNVHLYNRKRLTKTLNSYHLKKLAIDLHLFIDGKYQYNKKAYKPLAEYWKSLHPNNVAGYDWGWDANHFEMRLYATKTREEIHMKRIKPKPTPKIK